MLSADSTTVSFVVATVDPMQAGKPCDTADRNVCATLNKHPPQEEREKLSERVD